MNTPQILIIVFFSLVLFFRLLTDFQKGCSKYVDDDNSGAKIFGHMFASFFFNGIYFGIVFGLLIWGNFFSSK